MEQKDTINLWGPWRDLDMAQEDGPYYLEGDSRSYASIMSALAAAMCTNEQIKNDISKPQLTIYFKGMSGWSAMTAVRRASIIPEWDKVRAVIMYKLLIQKFSNNPNSRGLLLRSGSAKIESEDMRISFYEGMSEEESLFWNTLRENKNSPSRGLNVYGFILEIMRDKLFRNPKFFSKKYIQIIRKVEVEDILNEEKLREHLRVENPS